MSFCKAKVSCFIQSDQCRWCSFTAVVWVFHNTFILELPSSRKHFYLHFTYEDRGQRERHLAENKIIWRPLESNNLWIMLPFAGWLLVLLTYCISKIGHHMYFRKDKMQTIAELRINITWSYAPVCEFTEV